VRYWGHQLSDSISQQDATGLSFCVIPADWSSSYFGELTVGCVSPGVASFDAQVDKLIFRHEVLEFQLSGLDEPRRGKFYASGDAPYVEEYGSYVCAESILRYSNHPNEQVPSRFTFNALPVLAGTNQLCYVSINWRDPLGVWVAHGLLRRRATGWA